MKQLKFATTTDPHLDVAPIAQAVEGAGFDYLWISDSPLLFSNTDLACLLALQATTKLVVGPGTANPVQRLSPHTANLLATLTRAAPGRVVFGLGVGASSRRSLGMKPATPEDLRRHAVVVRDLMAGRDANYEENGRCSTIRFIHPKGRWFNLEPVPIWISAFGPKALAVAGEVADGVMVRWQGAEGIDEIRARLRVGAERVGRDVESIKIAAEHVAYPIRSEDDLDSPLIRAALGPPVISRLRYLTANAHSESDVPEKFRPGWRAYREYQSSLDERTRNIDDYYGQMAFVPDGQDHLVTRDTIKAVAQVASPEEIAREFRQMQEAGVEHVALRVSANFGEYCELIAREVFPLL